MATITEATKGKTLDANEKRGPLVVWKVKLDDGREAEMLRKPESPEPTGPVEVQDGPHGLKARVLQQDGRGAKDFKADPAKLRSENARSALHAAKDLVVAGKIPLEDMGKRTADFYRYITSHAEES